MLGYIQENNPFYGIDIPLMYIVKDEQLMN